jgi:hypothetical protein
VEETGSRKLAALTRDSLHGNEWVGVNEVVEYVVVVRIACVNNAL